MEWKGGAQALTKMVKCSSIPVEYHSDFGTHGDLVLLEVDDKLLPDVLQNRVVIRGKPDEEAVLCTPSTTFAMKFVGTSNSVFLVPPGDHHSIDTDSSSDRDALEPKPVVSVLKVAPGTMELVQIAPKLDKLKSLLKERPYRLEEDDMELDSDNMELDSDNVSNNPRGLYRLQDLAFLVQASDKELVDGLYSLSATEIGGFWRIIDEGLMDDILKMMLRNSLIHDWPISALMENEVLSVLEADGFPCKIVLHCLKCYGSKTESPEGDILWSLDEKKLCLHFAKQTLSGGKMKLENFMDKWMSCLPSEMHPDLEMLEGEVLYEKLGIETWICAFSVSSLPSSPAERFSALFKERPKWEGKDLQPYIRDLKVPGLSAEGLLIKYTRKSQPTGDAEPIYSAR